MRRSPDLQWERRIGHPSVPVVGVDEVGRGCLAGPVVAGAVAIPAVIDYQVHPWLSEIADSKCLTPGLRERLAPLIASWAMASAIGVASVEEIDRINIYHAAHLAMGRAVERVEARLAEIGTIKDSHILRILVDGNAIPKPLAPRATAVVKGDLQCLSIAAASIIAKVWRDCEMAELDGVYPGYGFGEHKGYSTPAHVRALREKGACGIHRRTFSPVAAVLGSA